MNSEKIVTDFCRLQMPEVQPVNDYVDRDYDIVPFEILYAPYGLHIRTLNTSYPV
jgi:hypothetical protein